MRIPKRLFYINYFVILKRFFIECQLVTIKRAETYFNLNLRDLNIFFIYTIDLILQRLKSNLNDYRSFRFLYIFMCFYLQLDELSLL